MVVNPPYDKFPQPIEPPCRSTSDTPPLAAGRLIDTQIPDWFEDRIIPLDSKIMREWGRLCAADDAGGRRRTLPTFDSLIAASALVHDLSLLTRNVRNFAGLENLLLVNPWEEQPLKKIEY